MRTVSVEELQHIESLIRSCPLCYVGMADEQGVPYVLPMNFGYEEEVIYLHSAQEGRSISILGKNPQVCITFCTEPRLVWQDKEVACSYRMRAESVICHGNVSFEEEYDEKVKALDIIMQQYSDRAFSYSAPAVKNVKIWKVPIDKVTAKEFGVPGTKANLYKDRKVF
ncbi:MAG: pyridoxamine 5'-phosphate oxidase family protein [Proteiniphilum sp.]|jgi:nitroimidazol reductase NimA-like FMN-containing flavoprotein (pyridoxamine 5'-phosphate oxidase superfamily)|nr:pyridoxamine 5'-phosphate oxidase family protein [Proteiniphilum sp.]MDD2938239.1 pyridoxamine 5'-phosphate oxidase family protein [Proteiniphilum sp.]MDD3076156.1 pyridoxamine 5'-phosphate oxidase family protein [Proteiniphilum sp.]MDD3779908.1 pyridoxamine 5'-phosphate oxidase family protein [Proteiniphilum sp.]MDD4452794.1 pyridoxamine 5'-phosphate oxidase family protein [Proteiniphilum sp.]